MLVLTAIRKLLQDATPVTNLAKGGIHLIDVPADSKRPNIALMLVSGSEGWTHQGPDGLQRDIVRIYSRSDDFKEAVLQAKAIKAVLNDYVSETATYDVAFELIQQTNSTGDYQDAAKVYRQIDDYRVTYREA